MDLAEDIRCVSWTLGDIVVTKTNVPRVTNDFKF